MKKINKFIILVLCIIIGTSSVYATEKEDNFILDDIKYNNLINLGFTSVEIENMNSEEYELNSSITGVIVSSLTEYYETITIFDENNNVMSNNSKMITEKEFNESGSNFNLKNKNGNVETNYKKMTTQIIQLDNSYRYKVSLEWKTIPSTRSYDIIGIGINSNVVINSSVVFKQTYCLKNGNCSTSSGITKKTSTGGAALFQLPSSSNVNSLSSYLYFDVNKNTSSTITEMYAYGDYAHSTSNVSNISSSDYTIGVSGISLLSNYSAKFDEISVAKAYWQGSW